jgi:hypothetical protein
MTSTMTHVITLTGIILSFLVGGAGLWIGIRNSRKTIFINSVTSSRVEYIQRLRNSISEFCGLVYAYYENGLVTGTPGALDIQKRFDNLKYLIELHLNIEDEYFDTRILKMIKDIRNLKDGTQIGAVEDKVEQLILIMQYLLKLEWEVVKKESQKGILSKKEKNKLYRKYVHLYEDHLQKTKS